MSPIRLPGKNSSFATLRRYVGERSSVERCDFCSAELADDHQHLVEPAIRRLVCVCNACAILFSSQGETKYRRVPRRVSFLPGFCLTDSQWEDLMLPIGLAFFFNSSSIGKVVALYPSPAGPTESMLDLASWAEIVQENPILQGMEPDVEGLLVNRVGGAHEYFLAPIDECYKLVGVIRAHWRGLSGGTGVWKEIERFFTGLKGRSSSFCEGSHA
jgi:hypothetical protein